MPFVEQLLYGSESNDPKTRRVLAQSPGLGQTVVGEIRQICEGWGPLPVSGLDYAAVMSLPLKGTIPALRGRLYAVVHVGTGPIPLHHVLVLTEADYTAYGHNPYAVCRAFRFLEHWRVGIILDRQEIAEVPDAAIVTPPPSQADRIVVTESLRQILIKGRLQLPLAQPSPESERALALIIAGLPNPLRRELRFASFATSEANGYTLMALGTPNCAFNGWQRLLMSEVAAIVPPDVETYANEIGARLGAGDLPGLCREARNCTVAPGGRRPEPVRAEPTPRPAPSPELRVERAAPSPLRPPARPATAAVPQSPSRPTAAAVPSAQPTPPKPRRSPRTSRLVRAGRELRVRGGGRPRGRRILPVIAAAVLVGIVLWWQAPAIERMLSDRIGWFAGGEADELEDHATTLLQVIDVGEAYDREVKKIAQAGFIGRDDPDRDRRHALLALQTKVAGPLLDQTDLFTAIAAEGIQQPDRPSRELDRLRSLDDQGGVIAHELRRLELAWHSLATGTDWKDLSRLDDRAIAARRDSLRRADPHALREAARELGTTKASQRVAVARRQVNGMVELLQLFQVATWSERWEEKLSAAAEKVSPRTSAATRAYRNAAFAFVRLKSAERARAAREAVYAENLGQGTWPSREVADVLPDLRQEVARFGRTRAPDVLIGTLRLYEALGKADELVDRSVSEDALEELAANPAVRFDEAGYADYFTRLRYEVASRLLTAAPDSAALPERLIAGDEAAAVRRFHAVEAAGGGSDAWWGEVETQTMPFLARWAERRAGAALVDEVQQEEVFDAAWTESVRRADLVRQRAAAGEDWTAVWLDLHEQVSAALDGYADRAGGDPARAARVARLAELKRSLEVPRDLVIGAATVRLPQEALSGPTELVLELSALGGDNVLRSEAFVAGPAAPAGSGWVGTVALNWRPAIGAAHALAARIVGADGTEVFAVPYPALAERVGPGAMARPRGEDGYTVSFQLDPSWWTGLEVPALE